MINERVGWAVGGWQGIPIVKTTDSGNTWLSQSSDANQVLRGVSFQDSLRGWAVGDGGLIISTSNGGSTWNRQSSGVSNTLQAVKANGKGIVIAVGANGVILRTTNSGQSWSSVSSGTTGNIYSVDLRAGFGCAVGVSGLVLRTIDNGATWTIENSDTQQNLYGVTVLSATSACAVGFNGTILKSTDRGLSWKKQMVNTSQDLRTVSYVGSDTGYVSGSSVILITKDGGKSWIPRPSPNSWILGSSFVSSTTGYFVGHYGGLYKTTTGGEILSAAAKAPKITSCKSDTVRFDVTISEGVAPYRYDWRSVDGAPIDAGIIVGRATAADSTISLTPSASSSYMVIVSDKRKLVDTVVFQSTVNPLPSAKIRSTVPGVLEGLTDVPTSRADCQWYRVDSTSWTLLRYENKYEYRPTASGRYGLIVTDNRTGCRGQSDVYDFVATSVEETSTLNNSGLQLYPNPTSNVLTIASTGENIDQIMIVDALGTIVARIPGANTVQHDLDVSHLLQTGSYTVVVTTPRTQLVRHLVIQR